MIIIISPSKTLDFSARTEGEYTQHDFSAKSHELIKILRKFTAEEIARLMNLSEKLSALNWQRYNNFQTNFTPENSHQAIFAFKGDVYEGLAVENFSKADIAFAQTKLRIISGLYGLLRPLDLIVPYRLEMGTKLATQYGKNLYEFWGDKITDKLNELLKKTGDNILVNLASEEYFKAINKKLLQGRVVTPVFMEKKGESFKIIALYAKQARGMMAAYIIKNRIENLKEIENFQEAGYKFNQKISDAGKLVFTR